MASFIRASLLLSLAVFGFVSAAQITASQHPKHATILVLGEQHPAGACLAKLQTLDRELNHFPYPSDWKLVVACNSVSWEEALRRADFPPTKTAFSGLKVKVTVLNGEVFNEQPAVYEHTLAHELGHIRCQCQSEGHAEDVAVHFLKSKEYQVSFAAPVETEGASGASQ